MSDLRVAILGPGGVGGLLAALLARQGASVVCLASESSARVINERGITLTSERFGSFDVAVAAETTLSSPVDVLCVTVKEVNLEDALERVPKAMVSGAAIVPFLNGIDHVKDLRLHFDESIVVAATIRVESSRKGAGDIHQVSPFTVVEIAPQPLPKHVETLCDLLSKAGVDVHTRDDEGAILWGKLSFLAPLALLTSAYSAPAGVIRTEHRDELVEVIREIVAVASSEGVAIDAQQVLTLLDSVPESMQSSMQRDLAAGLPIEIDAIGGAVVRHAHAGAIAVPTVDKLVGELQSRALGIV